MQPNRSSAVLAVLTSAFLFFFAAPSAAQSAPAAVGHGSYLAFNGVDTLEFTFFVAGHADGTAEGYALWRGPQSLILWQVTSATYIGRTVAFAGPVVGILGTPPEGYEVGRTAFTAVNDNGRGTNDETSSLSIVPAMYGNPTIQQIVAFAGPPPAYRTLLTGNIWTR